MLSIRFSPNGFGHRDLESHSTQTAASIRSSS